MNYTMKKINAFNNCVDYESVYEENELLEMFDYIEKKLIENRDMLNEKYGGEDKWDYSDSDGYLIDDGSERPMCLTISNLDSDDFKKIRERLQSGETIEDMREDFNN